MTEPAITEFPEGDDPARLIARYQSMLADVSDTILIVDEEGRMQVSTGIEDSLLGYDLSYWNDHTLLDVVHPDDHASVIELRDELAATPAQPLQRRVRMRRVNGEWLQLAITAVDRRNDPNVEGIVLTVSDITEQLRVNDRLEQLTADAVEQARIRNELVGRVSHELRNPVHALQGLIELLITAELSPSALQLVRSANRQAALLGRIVDDLLEFSRLEAGPPQPNPTPTDIRHLIVDAAELGQDLSSPRVEVLSRIHDDVAPVVLLDGPRVSQILSNLVTNAAKFTQQGTITISVAPRPNHPDQIRLEVVDTGPGIADSEIARLWKPFEQGDNTTAATYGGAGLGLAITKGLVEMLNGTVTVHTALGAGTRFAVDLDAPATGADRRQRDRHIDLTATSRILVVEDNPTNQLLVKEQLARLGAQADVVGTGEDAVAALEGGHEYGLVLMDWRLPGIDGLEATKRIRAAEVPGSAVPILAMTASALPADAQQCRDAGMNDLLNKPVGLDRLANAIQRWAIPGPTASPATDPLVSASRVHIDSSALDELVQDLGGVGPVSSIVRTYLTELDRRREAVAEAVATADASALRGAAHSLKATSATLGAVAIDALAREIESADFPPSDELLARFNVTCDATAASMTEWLASAASPKTLER